MSTLLFGGLFIGNWEKKREVRHISLFPRAPQFIFPLKTGLYRNNDVERKYASQWDKGKRLCILIFLKREQKEGWIGSIASPYINSFPLYIFRSKNIIKINQCYPNV